MAIRILDIASSIDKDEDLRCGPLADAIASLVESCEVQAKGKEGG